MVDLEGRSFRGWLARAVATGRSWREVPTIGSTCVLLIVDFCGISAKHNIYVYLMFILTVD